MVEIKIQKTETASRSLESVSNEWTTREALL